MSGESPRLAVGLQAVLIVAVHLEVPRGLHLAAAPAHFLAFFQHGALQ